MSYAVNTMDPHARNEMESTYSGHLTARSRGVVTQACVLPDLLAAVTGTKKKLNNTRKIITSTAMSLLMNMPKQSSQVGTLTLAQASVAERTIKGHQWPSILPQWPSMCR